MADNPPDPHKLCLQCGLCCNGAWFSNGGLSEDEVVLALEHGLRVEVSDGGARFRQPCPKHIGGSCSLYATWRPGVCSSYTCALLDKYVQRDIDEATALAFVAEARAMYERIVEETGELEDGVMGPSFMKRLDPAPDEGGTGRAPLSPEAKMDAVGLIVYFDRHFKRSEQDGRSTAPATVDQSDHGA